MKTLFEKLSEENQKKVLENPKSYLGIDLLTSLKSNHFVIDLTLNEALKIHELLVSNFKPFSYLNTANLFES